MDHRPHHSDSLDGPPVVEGERFDALHAGICLLALEWFRELNLPCNLSKVDVLDALGLDTSDYVVVEELRHRFMFQVRKHLLAGSILAQHVGVF